MSEFHTSSFRGGASGLFTPEQIRGLMRAEYERANRYGFPVLCLLIGVDRLLELQDLYGYESRESIVEGVVETVTRVTRASDFLGCMQEDRVLVLLTHTDRETGQKLAERILSGARGLEFQSEGRRIRVTVSIGVSHNQHRGARTFEGMIDVAEEALHSAMRSGGDRYVEREEVERELLGLEEQLARRSLLLQSEHEHVVQESLAQEQARQKAMEARLEDVFGAIESPQPELERIRDEMLALARSQMEEERDRAIAQKVSRHRGEIERLERRISKLTESLGITEAELARLAKLKNVDLGLSSIYREVQGIESGDPHLERKKELMKDIFRANVALRDSFKSRR